MDMENHDGHLCRKCKYHGTASTFKYGSPGGNKFPKESTIICDYIGHTGRARSLICDAGDCTVYEPKKRQRNTIPWSIDKHDS